MFEKKNKKIDQNHQLINEISSRKEEVYEEGFFSHLMTRLKSQGISGVMSEGFFKGYTRYREEKGALLVKFEAYETVAEGSTDTIEYYILLVLSGLIATVGLYQSSPAVIIGAMIVAPLMGPIFGFSASMLWGSGKLLRESITTLLKGVCIILLVSAGLSFVIPGIQVTPEMLARQNPGLFDILVAVCCGFIGAYSFINKRISAAIPGVAISVALLPPLCTAGIGIGLFEWELASGAAMLFAINLTGIAFAALLVFYLVKLHPQAQNKKIFSEAQKRAIGQIVVSVVLIILISVPLVFFTVEATAKKIENENIHTILSQSIPDDQVYSMDIIRGQELKINMILLGAQADASSHRIELEKKLEKMLGKSVELVIYTIGKAE